MLAFSESISRTQMSCLAGTISVLSCPVLILFDLPYGKDSF